MITEKLNNWMAAKGYTLRGLAQEISRQLPGQSVSFAAIQAWRRGTYKPNRYMLVWLRDNASGDAQELAALLLAELEAGDAA
jgi:hypothetical protein